MTRALFGSTVCVFLIGFLVMSVQPVHAQSQEDRVQRDIDEIQQLVQKPVAVDRMVEAGASPEAIDRLSEAMNRGEMSATEFNNTMRQSPELSEQMDGFNNVGSFVRSRVEEGLRGRELADSIHAYLNERGIPAGGNDEAGPPPVARNFIPHQAQQQIDRSRQHDRPGASSRSDTAAERSRGRSDTAAERSKGGSDEASERSEGQSDEAGARSKGHSNKNGQGQDGEQSTGSGPSDRPGKGQNR